MDSGERDGRTDRQRDRDMWKIMVTLSSFANVRKKWFVDNK
jgi:hypothetical protein